MTDRSARMREGAKLWALCCLTLVVAACHVASAGDDSSERRTPIVIAVQRARPSIVNINGEKSIGPDGRTAQGDASRRVNGMGTGVIVDPRGYIVTNHHVVEGVRRITVTTADRETLVAKLVAYDTQTDLAIIKVESDKKFPVIDIGTSSDLMPGETVVAVGNAFGYEHTVTLGIISALHRTVQVSDAQSYEDLIQTDASINPGNSGGPLLNIEGRMIGINVAVRAGAQGIGFAIPADAALAIVSDLLSTRRIDHTWHGVIARTDSPGKVVVGQPDDESPAAACGLKSGDIIKSVADQTVARALDIERAMLGRQAGDSVAIQVERSGKSLRLELVLGEAPEEVVEPADATWELLGFKLQPVPSRQFQQRRSRYRGGLTVTDVRSESPAARQGIRRGDILVGMHVWETVSLDNVEYILGRRDFQKLEPLKFYILRGNETLFGHLTVSHRREP